MATEPVLFDYFGDASKAQETGYQQGVRNQFRQLAPQIMSGDIGARERAYSLDPTQAATLEDAGDRQKRRLGNVVSYLNDAVKTGDQSAAQGAWNQARPELEKLVGKQLPQIFDDQQKQHLAQASAAMAGAQSGAGAAEPNAIREFKFMTQGMTPEQISRARGINLGVYAREQGGASKMTMVKGVDGFSRPTVWNPMTNTLSVYDESAQQFRPATLDESQQAAAAQAGMPTGMQPEIQAGIPAGQAQVIQPQASGQKAITLQDGTVIPPEEIPAFMQATEAARRGENVDIRAPAPGQAQMQQQMQQQMPVQQAPRPQLANPALLIGRPEEAEAGAVEAAKQRAQLEYMSQRNALEAQGAGATKLAQISAEQKGSIQKLAIGAADALNLLDEAERLLPKSTGSLAGTLADTVAGYAGYATEGAKAAAALKTIAGSLLMKMPRMEGPQSDKDSQNYKQAAGNLDDSTLPIETRMASLNELRRLQKKYVSQQDGGQGGGQGGQKIRVYNPATGRLE